MHCTHLKPHRNQPRSVALERNGTPNCTTGEDRPNKPKGVAVRGDNGPPGRMRSFHNIDGPGARNDGDSEAENESATLEYRSGTSLVVDSTSVDNDADDDDDGTDDHADSSTPGINARPHEWQCRKATNLVHGTRDGLPVSDNVTAREESGESVVRGETAEKHAVETIHGLTKASKKQASDEPPCDEVPEAGLFLHKSFMVGF